MATVTLTNSYCLSSMAHDILFVYIAYAAETILFMCRVQCIWFNCFRGTCVYNAFHVLNIFDTYTLVNKCAVFFNMLLSKTECIAVM